MAPMSDFEKQVVRDWLRERRGAVPQGDLAADITRVTKWNIDRTRYSKYETGRNPIGPTVLAKFVKYWSAKGEPGPDFTPPPAPVTLDP